MLAREVYHMSMGNLVDLVLTLFLDPVIQADDITEVASRFVHSLFLDLGRAGAEMFLADGGMSSDDFSFDADNNVQQRFKLAKKYSTLFDKSQAVGQFMMMRLDEIQRGLEEGVFQSVKARELKHLIIAAFDESEKRMLLLNSLASK